MTDSEKAQEVINLTPARKRILCIVDNPDWIFHRHATTLSNLLKDEFEISIGYRNQSYDENAYDLIYPLEFNMVSPEQIKNPSKYVTGIRSLIAWAEWDFLTLINFLVTHYQSLHVVSQELFDIFSPYIPGLHYVSHGVDTQLFSPSSSPHSDPDKLRLGWAGNRNTAVKGYQSFIQPLSEIPGIELVHCGYADRNLTLDEMPGFYNSIDGYVSASSFEGNNNTLLEAAAMEKAIITTSVGAAPEYLKNNISALIVERDLNQFKAAAIKLRDNPDLRTRLGKQARKAILSGGWDWINKAEGFRILFRDALQKTSSALPNRILVDFVDTKHYASVLHKQFLLVRELRIDQTLQKMEIERKSLQQTKDLQLALSNTQQQLDITKHELDFSQRTLETTLEELNNSQNELSAIRSSETYRLTEYIKSFWVVKTAIVLYNKIRKQKS